MRLGISKIIRMSLLAALLPGLTSCVTEDGYCPPSDPDGVYTVHLSISAGSFGTRSSGHTPEKGSEVENFINVAAGDYAVFILDEEDNFVQRIEPGAVSLERKNGNSYEYLINGAFKPEKEIGKIRLMVLANWQTSFGGSYNDFEKKLSSDAASAAATTVKYVFQNAADFNFVMPTNGTGSWTPEGSKAGIPMFGLSGLVTATNEVYEVRNVIPMLRAIAKIEIVDMVPDGQSANIEEVVLTSYNTKGRYIPHVKDGAGVLDADKVNAGWNVEGTQVTTPSLPEKLIAENGQKQPVGTDLYFYQTTKMVKTTGATEDESKDCFVVYVPEMDLRNLLTTDDGRPVLQVYLGGNDTPYIIQLATYDGGKDPVENSGYTSLLRNHIYRYNILSVGIDMKLTIESDPWDLDDDQLWDYEDAGGEFTAAFKWVDFAGNEWSRYDDSNIDDLNRILLIGSDESDAAHGRFTLETPKGNNPGTWTIGLVSDDDTKNDHFKIEVKSEDGWGSQGEKGDSYTAAIDGKKPVEFRIVATAPNSSATDYTARVVMVTKTFDGRMVNEKLPTNTITDPNDDKYYYRVKQLTNGGDNM